MCSPVWWTSVRTFILSAHRSIVSIDENIACAELCRTTWKTRSVAECEWTTASDHLSVSSPIVSGMCSRWLSRAILTRDKNVLVRWSPCELYGWTIETGDRQFHAWRNQSQLWESQIIRLVCWNRLLTSDLERLRLVGRDDSSFLSINRLNIIRILQFSSRDEEKLRIFIRCFPRQDCHERRKRDVCFALLRSWVWETAVKRDLLRCRTTKRTKMRFQSHQTCWPCWSERSSIKQHNWPVEGKRWILSFDSLTHRMINASTARWRETYFLAN